MCGIAGIKGHREVARELYEALTILQHRGQDAAGIATLSDGRMQLHKGPGLVREVFQAADLSSLKGSMGIGHVRYPTAGCRSADEAQPFYVNSPFGIALAHNGNLTNSIQLKKELHDIDRRQINTESDSEILLNVFAHELDRNGRTMPMADRIFAAVNGVYGRLSGGYAVIAMINGFGLLGFRDPFGIRPAVLGIRHSPAGPQYMIASESCALNVLGFEWAQDIGAGEAVFIDADNHLHHRRCWDTASLNPCIFEYVYLARPDSVMDGRSVYQARLAMGRKLAEKIRRQWPEQDIDVVIPVPDTSLTAASALAESLDVTYREGFVKNRYIGRTFIMPDPGQREVSVRRKLNAIACEFKNKNLLIVDDSIVRGTTSRQIIQMARDAGAKNVYFASASPPVRFANFYGIDMPSVDELAAHGRSEAQVAALIGADRLFYQDLNDLIACATGPHSAAKGFETSIFTGVYIAGKNDSADAKNSAQTRTCQIMTPA
jgi:amidophosphoribosyltransferase